MHKLIVTRVHGLANQITLLMAVCAEISGVANVAFLAVLHRKGTVDARPRCGVIARLDGIECLVVAEAAFTGSGNGCLGIVVALVAALQIDLHAIIGLAVLMAEAALDVARLKEAVVFFVVIHIHNIHGLCKRWRTECCQHDNQC
jgi:hypothetical protein